MKRITILLLLCLSVSTTLKAQDVPIEKFIGVWQTTHEYWSSNSMKISLENGKIILQIKNFVNGEATLNGNQLELTVIEEVNYGKWWVGPWGGWYDSDGDWVSRRNNDILVGHSDGSHGTNGEVTGFYPYVNHQAKANKEVEYLSVYVVYKYEGTLELYFTYHSTYYNGNEPLFYQSSGRGNPIVYTNW